jgi:hypothetical protein
MIELFGMRMNGREDFWMSDNYLAEMVIVSVGVLGNGSKKYSDFIFE